MLDNLNPTQADIKKESEKDQNQAQTDPAPGPVKDQARGSTTSSAHESFPGSAPEPKFGQAQSPNGTSNTTPRSRQSPTCAASTPGPNLETMKTPFVMKTPKFDSQLPIENWIYAMDIYMACYNLSEENIIKVSLAQLLTNDSGSSLIECFTPAELKSWNALKSKLIAVLGKDQEHFKHLYNTFKRENESQAMALMKLTAFFKKGYKKYNIDEADQQIICEKIHHRTEDTSYGTFDKRKINAQSDKYCSTSNGNRTISHNRKKCSCCCRKIKIKRTLLPSRENARLYEDIRIA